MPSRLIRRGPRLAGAVALVLALSTASVVGCGSGDAGASQPASAAGLRWPAPTLHDPTTIELGDGFTETKLDPAKDYVVDLPSVEKVGATVLVGGHDIVIVGGEITIPRGAESDTERRAIYVKDATGTVHIEGVQIDGSGGADYDGIDVAAPAATVQLENDRIVGVRGGYDTFHGDLVQTWGGVKDLRIDHLTGRSDYQGLTISEELGRVGSAQIHNVDITATPSPEPRRLAGGYMLWLTHRDDTCRGFPVTLSNVFITPRAGRSLASSVWPPAESGLRCGARTDEVASWPRLPVHGVIHEGPVRRSFVPAGAVGLDYDPEGN